jgi:hypothetical protein
VRQFLTPRIRRRRAGIFDDTTDAMQASACIRFVSLLYGLSDKFPFTKKTKHPFLYPNAVHTLYRQPNT